ncbi:GPI-anchored mannoprotein Ecym_4465 [Eremothecium cymbalariae DBVPG|uniref:Temperature shock-inducible protein 1 n=1 Tax=Eremothecium cymbalariae (strain CBS 270.75 / DBVPG 7215 / KCTC 17166 / NRRL Y-17582) TaxID=931890 RepID=G8JU02_ERECY|nr:hypothetical protein Ecym_4465 [Eremothecium cymbalariae DBVPG\
MRTTNAVAATAALLAVASAEDLEPAQVSSIDVVVQDIKSHLTEYVSYAGSNSGLSIPEDVISVYTQVATYTDGSYTSLFSNLNFQEINSAITGLPWYSSRLAPAFASLSPAAATDAPQSSEGSDSSNSGSGVVPAPAPVPVGGGSGSSDSSSSSGSSGSESGSSSESASGSDSAGGAAAAASSSEGSSSGSSSSASATSSATHSNASRNNSSTSNSRAGANNLQVLSTGLGIAAAGIVGLLL